MDVYNGEIISYNISESPSAKNIMDALEEAIKVTAKSPYRRTFHSDQGWAYQMKAYSKRLKEERIYQSMSRKANCLDNSVMENFFGILKQEIYYGTTYNNYRELKLAIEKYIKWLYTKSGAWKKFQLQISIKGFNQLRRQSLRNKKPPTMRVRDKS